MNVPALKIRHLPKLFAHLAKGLSPFVCIALLCNTAQVSADSESGAAAEYAVKAAYIYNILRFISWDENSALARSETLDICLFKTDPFNHYLDPIRKKSIGNKQIKLRTINDISQSSSCHLIFINNGDFEIDKIKHSNSILLGNTIDFVKKGGLFSFYIENNKVRLGANRNAIAESDLNISSQLLEVCQLYGEQR